MCTKHKSLSVLKSKKTEFGISPTQKRHLQTWGKKRKKGLLPSFLVTVAAAGDFPDELKGHNLLVYPTGSLTTLKKRILVLEFTS